MPSWWVNWIWTRTTPVQPHVPGLGVPELARRATAHGAPHVAMGRMTQCQIWPTGQGLSTPALTHRRVSVLWAMLPSGRGGHLSSPYWVSLSTLETQLETPYNKWKGSPRLCWSSDEAFKHVLRKSGSYSSCSTLSLGNLSEWNGHLHYFSLCNAEQTHFELNRIRFFYARKNDLGLYQTRERCFVLFWIKIYI